MTILFYPDKPQTHNRIYDVCNDLGIKFHNNPKKPYDHIFFWSYAQEVCYMDNFLADKKVINKNCNDIRKSRVEEIFSKHVNSTFINPLKETCFAVEKSEKQARHDGKVIKCPYKPEKGYVYQKNIDTKEGDYWIDYRLFYSGQVDFGVKKYSAHKFKPHIKKCEVFFPENVFTPEQIEKIESGCREFGLDFGEIDLLIDKEGEIYVIDVNNLPGRGVFNFIPGVMWEYYRNTFNRFILKWNI